MGFVIPADAALQLREAPGGHAELTGPRLDVGEAVESRHRLSDDPNCARRLLELVP